MASPSNDESEVPQPAPFTIPPMTATIFYFSGPKLAALKSSASPPSSYVSTYDALCAFIWSSITRARGLSPASADSPKATSMLGFAVDGRRRIIPSLPPTYLGNVNLYASARLPVSTLTATSALGVVASAIRGAITELDDARIRGVIALVSALPVVTDLKSGFNSFLGPDLAITSWREMGAIGLDWGAEIGKVESVRIPKATFDGLCIVLPALEDAGLEVLIGLDDGAMENLKKDETFLEAAEVRCT